MSVENPRQRRQRIEFWQENMKSSIRISNKGNTIRATRGAAHALFMALVNPVDDLESRSFAVVGTRTKDGVGERFRSPHDKSKWLPKDTCETLLRDMKESHPSWDWVIEREVKP